MLTAVSFDSPHERHHLKPLENHYRNPLVHGSVLAPLNKQEEFTYLADKLAAETSKPQDMKERNDEGDDGLWIEHAAKALRLLEQIGHDILVGELHALDEA